MNIMITRAAGFIGSHTAVELLAAGHYTVLLDNFSNSSPAVLERIAEISGRLPTIHAQPTKVSP